MSLAGTLPYTFVVTTLSLVNKGLVVLRTSNASDADRYIGEVREKDPLAATLLEISLLGMRHRWVNALRKGTRLISRVSGDPYLTIFLFRIIGIDYRMSGQMDVAENYFLRAMELAERVDDRESLVFVNLHFFFCKLFKAEYEPLYTMVKKFRQSTKVSPSIDQQLICLLSVAEITRGRIHEALKLLNSPEMNPGDRINASLILETKGLAMRLAGRLEESRKLYLEAACSSLEISSAYSAAFCAKTLELTRFAGIGPPPGSLIKKCVSLARRGSWGEQAAAKEIEALLIEDDTEACPALFEAALGYSRAYQPLEAFLSGLSALYLAWKNEGPEFVKIANFLSPMVGLYPGFRNDPVLGDFLCQIEPLLVASSGTDGARIQAWLIGGLRVSVDGKDLDLMAWHNKKALRMLIYFLLTPNHRLAADHLFYLIWPRRKYSEKTRHLIYVNITQTREKMGDSGLLAKRHDSYQLEGDVWTDLSELENLLRRADASVDPAEKEALLTKARELAGDELLPEFPYDRYVDEYRQYYERLRKRIFWERGDS